MHTEEWAAELGGEVESRLKSSERLILDFLGAAVANTIINKICDPRQVFIKKWIAIMCTRVVWIEGASLSTTSNN